MGYFQNKLNFSVGDYFWITVSKTKTSQIARQVTQTMCGTHLVQYGSGAGWRGTVWNNRNIIDGYNRRCGNQFCLNLRLVICLRA